MGTNACWENKTKVCIIGGGPTGLVTLRRVLENPALTGIIYEQKDDIGGLWNYKGEKQFATSSANFTNITNKYPSPENVTAMYDNLRTNGPYVMQQVNGFRMKKNISMYPSQQEIFEYMQNFANHFNLLSNIQLNTAVIDVYPENNFAPTGEPGRWIVKTHQHQEDIYRTEVYDAVVVCVGRYTYPDYPVVPGLDEFKGKAYHCKFFKSVEELREKNVVLMGMGPSSGDIVLMASKVVKKITVCHRYSGGFRLGLLPENARETTNVKCVTSDGVMTEENEFISCDALIFCTGYGFEFPFFKTYQEIRVLELKYVCDLYKMTIFTKRPTLAFFNIVSRTLEMLVPDIQARYFVSVLDGSTKLPSYQIMQEYIHAEEQEKTKLEVPIKLWSQIGFFGLGFWEYFGNIAKELGVKDDYKHFPLMEQAFSNVLKRFFGELAIYKLDQLRIIDDNTWEMDLNSCSEYPETKPGKLTMSLNQDGTVSVNRTAICDYK